MNPFKFLNSFFGKKKEQSIPQPPPGTTPGKKGKVKRRLYEQYVGPIPEGYIVVSKDGNPDNIRISNLEAISRKEQLERNLKKVKNATKNNK